MRIGVSRKNKWRSGMRESSHTATHVCRRGRRIGSGTRWAAVLPIGLLCSLLIHSEAAACDCDCYWSCDCGFLSYCSYGSCIKGTGTSGTDNTCATTATKLLDGECSFLGLFSTTELPDGADSLEFWLQAYESAGANGGGPPDPSLVALAQGIGLTSKQHEVLRASAIAIQVLYLGDVDVPPEHTPGFFTTPTIPGGSSCDAPLPAGDHGLVQPLDPCHLAVGALVRQAVVGELRDPNQGVFDSFMSQIPTVCPTYETFMRCEDDPEMPYPDGLTCLTEELRIWVTGLGGGPGNVPAVSQWGLLLLALLVATAGTLVFIRRAKVA